LIPEILPKFVRKLPVWPQALIQDFKFRLDGIESVQACHCCAERFESASGFHLAPQERLDLSILVGCEARKRTEITVSPTERGLSSYEVACWVVLSLAHSTAVTDSGVDSHAAVPKRRRKTHSLFKANPRRGPPYGTWPSSYLMERDGIGESMSAKGERRQSGRNRSSNINSTALPD